MNYQWIKQWISKDDRIYKIQLKLTLSQDEHSAVYQNKKIKRCISDLLRQMVKYFVFMEDFLATLKVSLLNLP